MASTGWNGGKAKSTQQAKAWMRHNSKEERIEANHSNTEIDKSRTPLNFSFRGLSYKQRCAAYDKRMGEIDQGKPGSGKNARTVLQSVTVYAPEALRGDLPKLREWFHRVGELAEQQFRPENVIDMAVDVDEVHSYLDEQEKVWKLAAEHGHLWLVPEVDGKLNGKQFSRRAAIVKFNDAIQYMTEREFGCAFNDGTKKKRRGTVEQLKARTLRAEVEQLQEQAETIITDAMDAAMEIRVEAARDARATRKEADQDRAEAKRERNAAWWDAQEAQATKDEADEYARTTRKQADQDAQEKRAAADRDAEATRQAAERDAVRIRQEATVAAQVAQGQAAAARLARDEAKKEATEYARKAQQLKQARDSLQTALQGDLRTFQAQEAKQNAVGFLDALAATVRPLVEVSRVRVPATVTPGTAAGSVWAQLQAQVARMDRNTPACDAAQQRSL